MRRWESTRLSLAEQRSSEESKPTLLLLFVSLQVSKVVTKVKQLVNVAKINTTLASTVVTIISNVMTSSETALAATSEKYGPLCSVSLY